MPNTDALADQMKLLMSADDGADVHFLVGGEGAERELLTAHKSILCAASDVFDAMFRFNAEIAKTAEGKAKSNEIRPIVVIDVEASAFKTMLTYIYTKNLTGLDNAMAVLYAAKKYMITGLVKPCLDFPIPELRNVFFAFAQARFIGEEDFARRCLTFIDENAVTLLQSDAFLGIDQMSLCEILDRDQLMINEELSIWNAALRWADDQCRKNGKECSAENRRAVLGPALYKIRLPLIPKRKFYQFIVPSDVLSKDERISVNLTFHSHPNGVVPKLFPLQFPRHDRRRRFRKHNLDIQNLQQYF